jgi:hypothetical protein
MKSIVQALCLCLAALLCNSCIATSQSRFSHLSKFYEPKPAGFEVVLFGQESPQRPFERISRIDVHKEKTHFMSSPLAEVLPELKEQARLSGADAIIEIDEKRSRLAETSIYHVTATGIRYTDNP